MRRRCADNPWPGMIVLRRHEDGAVTWMPCPECQGCTITSCCDGMAGTVADVTNAPAPQPEDGDG
jgi:hypothetical protein